MNMYGELEVQLCAFLASALDWSERSGSHPSHFTLRESDPQNPLDKRLGGPQNWSGYSSKEKNPSATPAMIQAPVVQPTA